VLIYFVCTKANDKFGQRITVTVAIFVISDILIGTMFWIHLVLQLMKCGKNLRWLYWAVCRHSYQRATNAPENDKKKYQPFGAELELMIHKNIHVVHRQSEYNLYSSGYHYVCVWTTVC